MTLADWSKKHGVLPTHPTTERGAVSVVCDDRAACAELYHLSDYAVSTVSGVVRWLVPKKPEQGDLDAVPYGC